MNISNFHDTQLAVSVAFFASIGSSPQLMPAIFTEFAQETQKEDTHEWLGAL